MNKSRPVSPGSRATSSLTLFHCSKLEPLQCTALPLLSGRETTGTRTQTRVRMRSRGEQVKSPVNMNQSPYSTTCARTCQQSYICAVVKHGFYHLRLFLSLKKFDMVMHAFVTLDDCNSLYVSVSHCKHESITPVLSSSHSVKYRVVYKSLHTQTPQKLSDLLHPYTQSESLVIYCMFSGQDSKTGLIVLFLLLGLSCGIVSRFISDLPLYQDYS